MALKPEAFQKCFQDWIADAMSTDATASGPADRHRRQDAVGGRTTRRKELGALHIVSAWASEEGIALGQVATEEKSNEITAIPAAPRADRSDRHADHDRRDGLSEGNRSSTSSAAAAIS